VPRNTAIIIGAGPAGLTAAYELSARTDIHPIVLDQSNEIGGLSRTVYFKGNRIDLGGHRFFSKSDRVMGWWLRILPLQATGVADINLSYQNRSRVLHGSAEGPDPESADKVMLIRRRQSRIYFRGKFFDYPISLNWNTFANLGFYRTARIALSYARAAAFRRPEQTLEDFFINRFGNELYRTFFKSYTEKVWGVPCDRISAEWGAQRVKGLSIWKTLVSATKRKAGPNRLDPRAQKNSETSLIQHFLYPKYGAGQIWEEVASQVERRRGEILLGWHVDRIEQTNDRRISGVWARHAETGELRKFTGKYYFSTMAVRELVAAMRPAAPSQICEIANGLVYRDFIVVGLLCRRLKIGNDEHPAAPVRDNWIYIHDASVKAGRLQIFNNWSPCMAADPSCSWLGVEYFCNDTDPLWRRPDQEIIELAKHELDKIKIIDSQDVLDATVVRVPKAYPAYFGTYDRFPRVIQWANRFENLFLIGRNGMHKYNNQDHSMLAAMTAVDHIVDGVRSRDALWSLNTEDEHHEDHSAQAARAYA